MSILLVAGQYEIRTGKSSSTGPLTGWIQTDPLASTPNVGDFVVVGYAWNEDVGAAILLNDPGDEWIPLVKKSNGSTNVSMAMYGRRVDGTEGAGYYTGATGIQVRIDGEDRNYVSFIATFRDGSATHWRVDDAASNSGTSGTADSGTTDPIVYSGELAVVLLANKNVGIPDNSPTNGFGLLFSDTSGSGVGSEKTGAAFLYRTLTSGTANTSAGIGFSRAWVGGITTIISFSAKDGTESGAAVDSAAKIERYFSDDSGSASENVSLHISASSPDASSASVDTPVLTYGPTQNDTGTASEVLGRRWIVAPDIGSGADNISALVLVSSNQPPVNGTDENAAIKTAFTDADADDRAFELFTLTFATTQNDAGISVTDNQLLVVGVASDSTPGGDSTETSALAVHISVSETGSGVDAHTFSNLISQAETGSGIDAGQLVAKPTPAETGSGSDAYTFHADLNAFVDGNLLKALSDLGGADEIAIIASTRTSAETGVGTDAATVRASYSSADTGSETDSGTRQAFYVSNDASTSVVEAESRAVSNTSADSGTAAEATTLVVTISAPETGVSVDGEFFATGAGGIGSPDFGASADVAALVAAISQAEANIKPLNLVITASGNEITDSLRSHALSAGQSADEYTSPDRSYGIWRAATNLFRRGQCDATTDFNTSHFAASTDATTPPPLGTQSIKAVGDGSQAEIDPSTATGLALAAGTTVSGSVWAKLVSGQTYQVLLQTFHTDASSTNGSQTIVTGTGNWQFIRALSMNVPAGKTCDRFRIRVIQSTGRVETIWIAHAMLEVANNASPYVATSGGSTQTRAAARVRIPSSVGDETQFWVAARAIYGYPSTSPPASDAYLFDFRDDANNQLACYFDRATLKWTVVRKAAGAGGSAVSAVQTFAVGDGVTVIAAFTATQVKISVGGAAFVAAANTDIPVLAASDIDVGSQAGASHVNGNVRWIAFGLGTLSDADAASIAGIRATGDPTTLSFPVGASTTAVWQANTPGILSSSEDAISSARITAADTGSGADNHTLGLHVDDTGTSSEVISTRKIVLTDTATGADIGSPKISTADTGSGSDAATLTKANFVSTDESFGPAEANTLHTAISDPDFGSDAEGQALHVNFTLAETGHGVENQASRKIVVGDVGTSSEAATVVASIKSADTGAGAQAQTRNASISTPDSGHGTTTHTLRASISQAELSTGVEGFQAVARATNADTGTSTDAGTLHAYYTRNQAIYYTERISSRVINSTTTGIGSDTALLHAVISVNENAAGTDAHVFRTKFQQADTGSGQTTHTLNVSIVVVEYPTVIEGLHFARDFDLDPASMLNGTVPGATQINGSATVGVTTITSAKIKDEKMGRVS